MVFLRMLVLTRLEDAVDAHHEHARAPTWLHAYRSRRQPWDETGSVQRNRPNLQMQSADLEGSSVCFRPTWSVEQEICGHHIGNFVDKTIVSQDASWLELNSWSGDVIAS